jgi:hypothetical protein
VTGKAAWRWNMQAEHGGLHGVFPGVSSVEVKKGRAGQCGWSDPEKAEEEVTHSACLVRWARELTFSSWKTTKRTKCEHASLLDEDKPP